MNVMEKLIEICFREFCDLAGDTPCGCDGCPYGEYEPDNGGCYVEYKKDKIEKLENDMDKYQKEDNGVTVQEWISVDERLPEEKANCIVYYQHSYCDNDGYWAIGICFYDGEKFQLNPAYKVTHWMPLPTPPKGE